MNTEIKGYHYPQRCYIFKAAKELSTIKMFTYSELFNRTKTKYVPNLKKDTFYAICAGILLAGEFIRRVEDKSPDTKEYMYELTEQGKVLAWRDLPTQFAIRRDKIDKESEITKGIATIISKESANNLSMAKTGESIFAYIETLKKQIYKQKETIEKQRSSLSKYINEIKVLNTNITDKQKAIEVLENKIRTDSGKTIKMSEIARVIETGELENST